ncbi:hypothetical protein LWI29_029712 [Acer saccharum]|uniref:Uncharacterized protein n=1 Tax=Acer saccharum TaxID=4024 RepID=A0AA39T793_ACESA|nr:hypothetical protein LWI29_029712 [Acer saccharum]
MKPLLMLKLLSLKLPCKIKGVLFWGSILSLEEVLSDRNLCFVGIGIRDKIPGLTLVLKKPKLCKCGLAELDKQVRINSTVASTASSTSSCPVTDSKVKVEIASLPDSKVTVEIASLPEMIECIPDWKAVVF